MLYCSRRIVEETSVRRPRPPLPSPRYRQRLLSRSWVTFDSSATVIWMSTRYIETLCLVIRNLETKIRPTFSALFSARVFISKPVTFSSFCNSESGIPLRRLTRRISASWQHPCARSTILVLVNSCFLPDVIPTESNFSRRIVSILDK